MFCRPHCARLLFFVCLLCFFLHLTCLYMCAWCAYVCVCIPRALQYFVIRTQRASQQLPCHTLKFRRRERISSALGALVAPAALFRAHTNLLNQVYALVCVLCVFGRLAKLLESARGGLQINIIVKKYTNVSIGW